MKKRMKLAAVLFGGFMLTSTLSNAQWDGSPTDANGNGIPVSFGQEQRKNCNSGAIISADAGVYCFFASSC